MINRILNLYTCEHWIIKKNVINKILKLQVLKQLKKIIRSDYESYKKSVCLCDVLNSSFLQILTDLLGSGVP